MSLSTKPSPFWKTRQLVSDDAFYHKTREAVGTYDRVNKIIQIPVFHVAGDWLGASDIKVQFNYTCSAGTFRLLLPYTYYTDVPNFCACIRWRVGTTVYRYKLWENVGELLYVDLYDNQVIPKYFCIEIWNTSAIASVDNYDVINIPVSLVGVNGSSQIDNNPEICSDTNQSCGAFNSN